MAEKYPLKISILMIVMISAALIIIVALPKGSNESEAIITFQTEVPVTFNCEVADTSAERAAGLMNRETLAQDWGMLFVFDTPQNVSFWMKNTLIPLDIIFIDSAGKVVNIEQADPEPGVADAELIRYCSDSPVKWVLEVNQGLCAENLIIPGTQIIIE
uniref:DUF192 domain-containing protein n=1 Tax=uncultured Thermoplasmata archaeon TaxID=376542 RepID=A0A871YEF7_9ARCH|nr:DUF192 domain-containing protein [uncultured Thermoplasmata archaeon]